jgi:hypothetical protein
MQRLIVPIFLIAAVATGYSVRNLGASVNPPYVPSGLDAQETHASMSLLGQFKTSASAWLWLHADLYLHNGVEMREMTDTEKQSGIGTEDAADDGKAKLINEDTVLTTVPSKERDFRGIFGEVERATSAYKDMHHHHHNDPRLALPLFRLMTWIDPDFVPAWVQGAAIIARDRNNEAAYKALEYLKDGRRQDPFSVSIVNEIGQLYITRLHNLPKAVEYLEQARIMGRHRDWVLEDSENNALLQCYRWLSLCYRDLGNKDKLSEVASEGLRRFRDDPVLTHLLYPPPSILTPSAQKKWISAHIGES